MKLETMTDKDAVIAVVSSDTAVIHDVQSTLDLILAVLSNMKQVRTGSASIRKRSPRNFLSSALGWRERSCRNLSITV